MMAGWTMSTEAWIWMGAWALVLVGVVWLLVRDPRREPPPDATAILRARFARGEITEDELRQGIDALNGRWSAPRDGDRQQAEPPKAARHD